MCLGFKKGIRRVDQHTELHYVGSSIYTNKCTTLNIHQEENNNSIKNCFQHKCLYPVVELCLAVFCSEEFL